MSISKDKIRLEKDKKIGNLVFAETVSPFTAFFYLKIIKKSVKVRKKFKKLLTLSLSYNIMFKYS